MLACFASIAVATDAAAQMGGFGGGHGGRHRQAQSAQPPPAPSLPVVTLDVWPRLDPGAVFCETEADLGQFQAKLEGAEGRATGGLLKCRTIGKTTAITILNRASPARTEVQLADDSHTVGWTNAYLPTKRTP